MIKITKDSLQRSYDSLNSKFNITDKYIVSEEEYLYTVKLFEKAYLEKAAGNTKIFDSDGKDTTNTMYNKKHTQETKDIISKKASGRPSRRKGIKYDKETASRMGSKKGVPKNGKGAKGIKVAWNKGIKYTEEQKANIKNTEYNKNRPPKSEETRQIIRDALAKIPKQKCVYCDMTTTPANIKRWHNDNCKKKND